jgi:MFS family permease
LFLWPNAYRALFLLTLIPGLLVVAITVVGLREASDALVGTHGASTPERAPHDRFDPRFPWLLAAIAIFTLGNSSDAFLLVRAEELGVAPVWLPTLWCAFHLAKSGGNLIAGRITDGIGARPMLLGGWVAYAAIYAGFAFATAAWHAWALFGLYALYYAAAEPAEKTLVAEYAASRRGLAFGWFNFALGAVALPANLLCGALYREYGPRGAFGAGALLAVMASLLLARLFAPGSVQECAADP